MNTMYVYVLGAAISVAVSVLAILFAVKCKYRTAKWRGAGARCFWFSILFIVPTIIFELLGERLLFRVNAAAWSTFGENGARFACALDRLLYFIIFVGGAEEAGKILAVYIGTGGYHRMKSQNEIINYALISAAAFTGLENILYYVVSAGNLTTAIARTMISSPFHITCTLLIARGVLQSMQTKRHGVILKSVALSVLIHGLYDFIADYVINLQSDFSSVGTLFVIFMVVAMIFVVLNILKAPRRYAAQNATSTCKTCGTVMPGLAERCSVCSGTAFLKKVEFPPMTFPQKEQPMVYTQQAAYPQYYAAQPTDDPQPYAQPQQPVTYPQAYVQQAADDLPQQPVQQPEAPQ